MSYLVDTNVLSELAKVKPASQVVTWLREHEPELYVSTITIGELRKGIEGLPEGKRKGACNRGSWVCSGAARLLIRPILRERLCGS